MNYQPVIGVNRQTFQVQHVSAKGNASDTPLYDIRGHTAHWLYIALTGRSMQTHPDYWDANLARSARAYIQHQQWWTSNQVLLNWGHHIWPWFGVIINENGVQKVPTEIGLFVSLINGKPMGLNEIFAGIIL